MEANALLPRSIEIDAQTLGFIGHEFKSKEDLRKANDLATELNAKCCELGADLQSLQRKLGSLLVSWSSRSIHAKASLQDLIVMVENLNLITSQYETNSHGARKIQKILTKELPFIAKELHRIAELREYAEIALKLEALVGDLEDAMLCVLRCRTGDLLSRISFNPSTSRDFDVKQENILQAVKAINDVEDLLLTVVKLHPQWCHLLQTVDARVDKILGMLRPQVLADHRILLSSLGWPPKVLTSEKGGEVSGIPNPLVLMQGHKRDSYSQSFLAVSALQHVQIRREERQLNTLGQKRGDNFGLWAIDELVSPISSRIEYHLLKWITQPELIFALVYKVTRDFIRGVDDVLQPLIDRARLGSYSAKEAWVSAMVQMLSTFLAKRVFIVLAEKYKEKSTKPEAMSSWLHLVDLIVVFDKRMESLINSDAYLLLGVSETVTVSSRTMSVLSLFCDKPDWLRIWGKIELKESWQKLKAELKLDTAWVTAEKHGAGQCLDRETQQYLLASREHHKAPLIAEFALKIAWEMIARCQTLPSALCRIQFIRSTASKFLWHFLNILLLRHERTEFPANGSDEALMTVSLLINAARFCEFKLQEWSDDVNLLELRIAENGQEIHKNADAIESCSFFHEEIKSLTELETNWLMEMIAHILHQFEMLSFDYFHNVNWFEQALMDLVQAPAIDVPISDDLVEALDTLRSQLLLIKQYLNPKDFLDLWRSVADGLDHFISRSILGSDVRFSDEGARQFIGDMQGLFLVYRAFCAHPEAFFPCICDLLKLLKLDREQVTVVSSFLLGNEKGIKNSLLHGISHLSMDQAHMVLSNRMFKG